LIRGDGLARQWFSLPMLTAPMPRLTLVIGGARSGKSRYAEGLVTALPPPWLYVATAEALDDEMRERIAGHRARRAADWDIVEAPLGLPEVVEGYGGRHSAMLIDCLTLWLSNVMLGGRDPAAERGRLLRALSNADRPIVAVSNEVGLGIVPDNALARRFRDEQGRLNAEVAAVATRVVLTAAGLPLVLKQEVRS
jgi:adenosylcobinamide kinase / adenosylcobinamide-phosphate guanylyltransferase